MNPNAVIRTLIFAAVFSMIALVAAMARSHASEPALSLEQVDREPASGRRALDADRLAELEARVDEEPGDRGRRLDLVFGLMASGELERALAEAREWRARDAYNLVVVRLMGDILSELGERDAARRVYSAVVELLPEDVAAHRALATVLKQSGDIEAAYHRLAAAAALAPDDARLRFELADAAGRTGREAEAAAIFEAIVADESTPDPVRYPARQRLAQAWAARRRAALEAGDTAAGADWKQRIASLGLEGGAESDIKVYLTWDSDGTDVDLWVTNPAGEKVFYSHPKGRFGGALYHDVTDGYGPESFTAHEASRGTYLVEVQYYAGGRGPFAEARGEVVVILDEGRPSEQRHVLPYHLFRAGQKVTVARVKVSG